MIRSGGRDPRPQPSLDVLEGGAGSGSARPWSGWSVRRRRAITALVLGPVVAMSAVALAQQVRGWSEERARRDQVAVEVELGVDATSTAGSPTGRGRVDYFVAVRNIAPRPLRVVRLGGDTGRLRLRDRGVPPDRVPPGGTAYLPLAIALDCSRRDDVAGDAPLPASVTVVASSGRRAEVATTVRGARPLTSVARTLCALDPDLRLREMSGPTGSVLGDG